MPTQSFFFFSCLTLSFGSISDEISRITSLLLNFKRIMSSPDKGKELE